MQLDRGTRVALVAEELSARPDEGALKVLERLCHFLSGRYDLRAYHARGEAPHGIAAERLPFMRAGISWHLRAAIRGFSPRVTVYAPSASITVFGMWRARILRIVTGAPVVLVGLQKRDHGFLSRIAMRFLRPDVLVVTSRDVARPFEALGWNLVIARVGVDLDRFRPLSPGEREAARAELGWNDGRRVILHVGHLRQNRGVRVLSDLARDPQNRVVFVASISELGEEALEGPLVDAGVDLRREFIPQIERFYQAADAYVFPVHAGASAIDFPLSVLEALACGLPALCTRHGALPEVFDEGRGLRFFDPSVDPGAELRTLLAHGGDPRALVVSYGWEVAFEDMFAGIQEVLP